MGILINYGDEFETLSKYASLADAISTIGASTKALLVNQDATVSTNLTIPRNVTLKFSPGNIITVNSGIELTIQGHIDGGLYRIFNLDAGGILKGQPQIEHIYPQWFGAAMDGVTNDTTPVQQAVDWIKQIGDGSLMITGGFALIDPIDVTITTTWNGVTIQGNDKWAGFKCNSVGEMFTFNYTTGSKHQFTIKNLNFDMNNIDSTAIYFIQAAITWKIDTIWIYNPPVGGTSQLIRIGGTSHIGHLRHVTINGAIGRTQTGIAIGSIGCSIQECSIYGCDIGIQIDDDAAGVSPSPLNIFNNRIDGCNRPINTEIKLPDVTVSNMSMSLNIWGNHFEEFYEYGVYLRGFTPGGPGASRCNNVSIFGNYFTNYAIGGGSGGTPGVGIYMKDGRGISIVNNTFKDCLNGPVEYGTGVSDVTYMDNYIFSTVEPAIAAQREFVNSAGNVIVNDIEASQYPGKDFYFGNITTSGVTASGLDVTVLTSGNGVVLLSPGGTQYRIQVDDLGTLTTTAI